MGCEVDGWSAVSSATANAALAGVLAGFMLNGVAVLLGRTEKGPRFIQALTLLFAAFVALGLDAYLWGLVTPVGACHGRRPSRPMRPVLDGGDVRGRTVAARTRCHRLPATRVGRAERCL
jgi:hypothetical protein